MASNRIRMILVGLGIIVLIVGSIAFYAVQSTQNAPLALGSSISSGQLVQGAPPAELLVVTNSAGTWDVARLLPDGAVIYLTDDGTEAVDGFGSFDFAGEVVNFLSNRGDPDNLGPTRLTLESGEIRTLSTVEAVFSTFREQRFDWDPAWSPDGETLLWASVRDLNLELYTMPISADMSDISKATRRTERGALDWFAAWSADGTQIGYASDDAGNQNIYLLDVATGEETQLTDHPADDIHLMFPLAGDTLAFVSERENAIAQTGTADIFLIEADGSNLRKLADDDLWEGDPQYAPDGRFMAFVSNAEGTWQVFVRDLESGTVTQVTEGDSDWLFPVWRP